MPFQVKNLQEVNRAVEEKHQHVTLSRVNDSCLKMAVNEQDYPWHCHPNSDELFIMIEGELAIDFQDGHSVVLKPNDTLLIPAGTIHRSRPSGRAVNLLVERQDTETVFVDKPV